jgi:hypothetical protein
MTDLEIIKRLEKKLSNKLIQSEWDDFSLLKGYHYCLNENGKVTALSLSLKFEEYGSRYRILSNIDSLDNIITSIAQLEYLKYLNLRTNNLHNIDSLSKLKNILYLDLSENFITNLDSIGKLTQLKCLNLSKNKITDITPLINCNEISVLFLQKNYIEEVPFEIFNLKVLEDERTFVDEVRFVKDQMLTGRYFEYASYAGDIEKGVWEGIEIDPNSIGLLLKFLKQKFIDYNPLVNPPLEIIQQGREAIKNYFDQINEEKGGIKRLFEVKLLVVGDGRTGKTSFIRKMKDANAEMPKEEDTTLGIETSKWSYFIEFPKAQESDKVEFHVNFWDFGGQKIYQGTHQVFFSHELFYVLVADTREQKTDFNYWLNTVGQLGGDSSSLVIILNTKYGHEQKFDEAGYRNHYGTLIREIIKLDLKNDIGEIFELQDKIKMYIKQLPRIGGVLPSSWGNIREELLKEKVNFISFDRFRQICSRYNITDYSVIHTLSSYFDRIGAFTHFIDDPLLQERIYLNSNWLIKTVYEVLDNKIVETKKGRITNLDIKNIWGSNELQYEITKLTQLMHKFGLMYSIPGTDNYVVPAHLPTVMPYQNWIHAGNYHILQFIYEFDKYMPQGIMSG